MNDALIRLLREGIAAKEAELAELRANLRKIENESNGTGKRKRTRKEAGPREGSIPYLIQECLREAQKPLGAADISEKLKAKGKTVESRFVAASINRYVEDGRVFSRTDDGLYSLRSDAA